MSGGFNTGGKLRVTLVTLAGHHTVASLGSFTSLGAATKGVTPIFP